MSIQYKNMSAAPADLHCLLIASLRRCGPVICLRAVIVVVLWRLRVRSLLPQGLHARVARRRPLLGGLRGWERVSKAPSLS